MNLQRVVQENGMNFKPMNRYSVRPVEQDDVESIASVAGESWAHTYGSIYPRETIELFISSAYSHDRLSSAISRDSERAVRLFHAALNEDGKIIGYSQSRADSGNGNSFELLRIYTLPSHLGTGVGTALLDYLFANCPDITELSAWVESENRLGRNFYEHHGFKIADEKEEDFFGYRTLQIKYKLTRKL